MTKQERIFSGIQPTGIIHVGNYVGAIRNWVALQKEYECIFCVVDYHAITIDHDPERFHDQIMTAARTLLSCGIDPEKSTLFVQSHVAEHTELAWICNCITPIGDLERMTQFKDKSEQHRENINAGLLTYPLLQAADILLYKAQAVPVGEDQVQHIEITRRTARRFNTRFGETFPEPRWILSETPRILGLDGKTKMSKSLDNYIGILEPPDAIWEKLRTAVTDENRKRRKDPGDPGICNLFSMHKAFTPAAEIDQIAADCRNAAAGCVDCKKKLFSHMMQHLDPIQQKARRLEEHPDDVADVLSRGALRCTSIADSVMSEVREKLGMRRAAV